MTAPGSCWPPCACVSENAEDAIAVVETAMSWYGIPRMLLSDNGTALNPSRRGWLGRLVAMLVRLGVTPVSSTPKHPRTCGKKERANSTLKRWLRARPRATRHAAQIGTNPCAKSAAHGADDQPGFHLSTARDSVTLHDEAITPRTPDAPQPLVAEVGTCGACTVSSWR